MPTGIYPHKSGWKQTEEAKRKIRESKIGEKNPNFNKPTPEQIKKKISISLTGKKRAPFTKKHRANISASLIGNKRHLGKKHDETTREKISKKVSGVNSPNFGKHPSEITKQKIREKRLKQILPRKNTSIERLVFDELLMRGNIFEKHYPIIGQPDIAFPEQKIAVFCDGCYWHGCQEHCPGKNIDRREKDQKITNQLREQGWLVLRYWEHEINENPIGIVDEIEAGLEVMI
jgi:DNA mismatch endonuclease (patch repair protein)